MGLSPKKVNLSAGRKVESKLDENAFDRSNTHSSFVFPATGRSGFQRQNKFKFERNDDNSSGDSRDFYSTVEPFNVECEMKEHEVREIKSAFDMFKDWDGCISIR